MFKHITASVILSCVLIQPSFAVYTGPGTEAQVTTAEQARQAKDDTQVRLKGSIVRSLGDDEYLFRDATGEVKVEIKKGLWRYIEVTGESIVVLKGEVDDNWNGLLIEIDSIDVIEE